jgi:hypothetical protein
MQLSPRPTPDHALQSSWFMAAHGFAVASGCGIRKPSSSRRAAMS